MTYEYWSNVHKVLVSPRRPLRVALRMWMTPVRLLYFRIGMWERHNLARRLLLAVLAMILVAGFCVLLSR